MTQNEAPNPLSPDFNRRDFIKGASFSSLMLMMGGIPLHAEDKAGATTPAETNFKADHPPVAMGVIGCGLWGREILQTLPLVTNMPPHGSTEPGTLITPVVAICDNYKKSLTRAKALAPNAETFEDYHQLLAQKNVEAVIIATPTHLHREIVEAALKAGKHVYCEAPLAHTVEDALAIAKAAKAAERLNFQSGLQMRSDPAKHYVLHEFVRTGAIGTPVLSRTQWHNKGTWRRASSDPAREKELNWQLDKSLSTGLAGEVGIQQIDLINWFYNELPKAVSGFSGIMNPNCRDGREVPDTIQAILQYPNQANFFLDCTLASSFDREYSMLYGNFATIMMRESKAWLFQEIDSPLMGWEIYATKEQFKKESGITLSADATKSVKLGKAEESPYADSVLHYALKAFAVNCHEVALDSANFVKDFGADADGLLEYLAKPEILRSREPAAGYKEGLEATIIALKTNEAVLKGEKVALPKELFDI